jgi:hypothetical protein
VLYLAHEFKQDPYHFRRRLLETAAVEAKGKPPVRRSASDWPQPDAKRTIAMLDLVTQKAEWGKDLGRNRGRGIS